MDGPLQYSQDDSIKQKLVLSFKGTIFYLFGNLCIDQSGGKGGNPDEVGLEFLVSILALVTLVRPESLFLFLSNSSPSSSISNSSSPKMKNHHFCS